MVLQYKMDKTLNYVCNSLSQLLLSIMVSSKWTDDEVELLRRAVQQFGNDLEKISETIKTRTM